MWEFMVAINYFLTLKHAIVKIEKQKTVKRPWSFAKVQCKLSIFLIAIRRHSFAIFVFLSVGGLAVDKRRKTRGIGGRERVLIENITFAMICVGWKASSTRWRCRRLVAPRKLRKLTEMRAVHYLPSSFICHKSVLPYGVLLFHVTPVHSYASFNRKFHKTEFVGS